MSNSPVQRKSPSITVAIQTNLDSYEENIEFRKRTNTCPEIIRESSSKRRSRTTQSYDREIKSSWPHSKPPTKQTSLEDFKELLKKRRDEPRNVRYAFDKRFSVIQEESQDNETERLNDTKGVGGTLV